MKICKSKKQPVSRFIPSVSAELKAKQTFFVMNVKLSVYVTPNSSGFKILHNVSFSKMKISSLKLIVALAAKEQNNFNFKQEFSPALVAIWWNAICLCYMHFGRDNSESSTMYKMS